MKVIAKKNLKFVDGYILDKEGTVVNSPELVTQCNQLLAMEELNLFVKENKEAIENSGKIITFHPVREASPFHVTDPDTPEIDAQQARALAVFNELEAVDAVRTINNIMLKRFNTLAHFINDDNVLVTGDITTEKFVGNPLEIDEAQLVSIVTDFVETTELRNKIAIEE